MFKSWSTNRNDSYLLWLCVGAGIGNSTYYTTLGGCLPGDHLEISDGSSSQRYCGTSTPAPLTTTNTITVKLHLVDHDVSGTGSKATICCSMGVTSWQPSIPASPAIQAILLQYSQYFFNAINTILLTSPTALENIIWSPNYPHSYDGNYEQVRSHRISP